MRNSILTPLQRKVLTSFFQNDLGKSGYYLTGGTALAEFYLHHRYSDDLDFFTRKQGPLSQDFDRFINLIDTIGLTISSKMMSGEYLKLFVRQKTNDNEDLKIEFARDVPAQMAPSSDYGGIVVDSYEDIAVNKICAILGRQPSESKDFCDLYFILKDSNFTLDYLIGHARGKEAALDTEDGILSFTANLMAVRNLQIMPRMIKPVSREDLEAYLYPLAIELAQRFRPKGTDH